MLDLPCGCLFIVNENFVGGTRRHECEHEMWEIVASRPVEIQYDMKIIAGGKSDG